MNDKKDILYSPLDGTVVSLKEVPDPVFSTELMGRGFAVKPETGKLCSPADATVKSVAETKHAYVLKTTGGVEMLIHVGLETVYLKGEPFNCAVKEGDKVKAGDLLCKIDLEMIEKAGADTIVPITFPKIPKESTVNINYGKIAAGEEIMTVEYKRKLADMGFLKKLVNK